VLAGGVELLRDRLELGAASRPDHHPCALTQRDARDLAAEARPDAGHDHRLA
jgi:hypothetical protein